MQNIEDFDGLRILKVRYTVTASLVDEAIKSQHLALIEVNDVENQMLTLSVIAQIWQWQTYSQG